MSTSPRKISRKYPLKKVKSTENFGVSNHEKEDKIFSTGKKKGVKSRTLNPKEIKKMNAASEHYEESNEDEFAREMTKEEIARENLVLLKAEEKLKDLKTKIEEKEIIFNKLLLELKRMAYIFNKVKEIEIGRAAKEVTDEVKTASILIDHLIVTIILF